MRRTFAAGLALALALAVAACSSSDEEGAGSAASPSADSCTPGRVAEPGARTFELGGTERTYLLAVPAEYDGTRAAPLVLDLHGFGGNAEEHDAASRLSERGTARGYIVVTPNALTAQIGDGGPRQLWNFTEAFSAPAGGGSTTTTSFEDVESLPPNDDVAFLDELVDALEEELCIDERREYVTGMSAGAGMATWLACQPSTRFAAFAPVAGLTQGKVCPAETVPPFLTIHGDEDAAVPYTGGDLSGFPLGIPAVEARTEEFALAQGCDASRSEEDASPSLVHIVWDCPPGAAVELYKVVGGTHTYPGSEDADPAMRAVDGTTLILDFFDEHERAE